MTKYMDSIHSKDMHVGCLEEARGCMRMQSDLAYDPLPHDLGDVHACGDVYSVET